MLGTFLIYDIVVLFSVLLQFSYCYSSFQAEVVEEEEEVPAVVEEDAPAVEAEPAEEAAPEPEAEVVEESPVQEEEEEVDEQVEGEVRYKRIFRAKPVNETLF